MDPGAGRSVGLGGGYIDSQQLIGSHTINYTH